MSPTGSKSTWQHLYSVAATARSKLGFEAERSEHQLRLLVSHANLLDSLMEELERVKSQTSEELRQSVRWADKVADQLSDMADDAESASDSEDSDDSGDERNDIFRHTPIRSRPQRPVSPRSSVPRTSTPPPPRLRPAPGRQPELHHSNDAAVSKSPKLKHIPRLQTITERNNTASSDEEEDEIRTPTSNSRLSLKSLQIVDALDTTNDLSPPTEEEKAEAIVTSVASVISQTTDSNNPMGQEPAQVIAKGPAIAKPVSKPPKIAAAA